MTKQNQKLLVFPTTLFKQIPENVKEAILIEHPLFFGNDKKYPMNFHSKKIELHKNSMRFYESYLNENGIKTTYIAANEFMNFKELLGDSFVTYRQSDFILNKRLEKELGSNITFLNSPMFINTEEENRKYFETNRYFQTSFYIFMRKKLNILVDESGKPVGGKWTFDKENRKKLPKNIKFLCDDIFYPSNFQEAQKQLLLFLDKKFENFGIYEDAILDDKSNPTLFHSNLSSSLNIGLLTPLEVVNSALDYGLKHDIPINSIEGFIRQIIGWREYLNAVYQTLGLEIRQGNFFEFSKKLPPSIWECNTGFPPVDDVLRSVYKTAYAHHIERLMILGNFMLLSEIHPNEVYKWFMENFIDAYDWVMVPNVYSMSQYADGGKITTKPYISGSNYILKMSNYKNSPDEHSWQRKWTKMYWGFVDKHLK